MIETKEFTHRDDVNGKIRDFVLEHRISCSKRFISASLILDTNEGFDHNFSILMAHHFCLKTTVVERIQTITQSWDMTKIVIETTLKKTKHPRKQHFMDVIFRIVKTHQAAATIEKVAYAVANKPTFGQKEFREMFDSWGDKQLKKIESELKDVFAIRRWNKPE